MKMTQRILALMAAATLATTLAPAHAAVGGAGVQCDGSISTTDNVGYVSCQGPITGNVATQQNNQISFAGFGSFSFVGASNDGSGVFSNDPGTGRSGWLDLANIPTTPFVIGLKGGPTYSLYLFNPGQPLATLDFDTWGIAKGNGQAGPNLSHAALYLPAAAVPEPGTWALLTAGLLAVAFMARRRRVAARPASIGRR